MILKINSIRYFEREEVKKINVVVDINSEDGSGLAQTWVEIPYDENLTTGKIQELSFKLAQDKLQMIANSF